MHFAFLNLNTAIVGAAVQEPGPAAAAASWPAGSMCRCAADVPRTYLGARHDPHPAGSWDARRRSIPPLPQAQKLISMRRGGVRASDLLLVVD